MHVFGVSTLWNGITWYPGSRLRIPLVSVSGVCSNRSMAWLERIPKDTRVLAVVPSASSVSGELLDAMRPNAPTLLNHKLALGCLYRPFGGNPSFGQARGLFYGLNVIDDSLAMSLPRVLVVPRGLDPGRIKLLVLPNFVEEIAEEAFCGWQMLEVVSFAEDSRLEKLGAYCFSNSGIEKIVIPKGVKELQNSAFRDCESLKDVVFEDNS